MSSNTPTEVIAYGKNNLLKDCVIKGHWNDNWITLGTIKVWVDKNIHEHGGGQNTRCLVKIKDGNITATSSTSMIKL
jgi:hypothetical protein